MKELSFYRFLFTMICRPYSRNDRQPAVDQRHPQRLLNIDPPRLPSGQVARGFLGYAVNLVHLSPEHMQVRVATRQQGEFGLRESLFFYLLGMLQVYDTRQHMISAKEALGGFNSGAISLDGGIYHRNQRQQLGRRRYPENSYLSFVGSWWHYLDSHILELRYFCGMLSPTLLDFAVTESRFPSARFL